MGKSFLFETNRCKSDTGIDLERRPLNAPDAARINKVRKTIDEISKRQQQQANKYFNQFDDLLARGGAGGKVFICCKCIIVVNLKKKFTNKY